jgi:hypothetical protein
VFSSGYITSDGEQKVDGSARVHTPAASHQFGDVLVRKRIAGKNAYKMMSSPGCCQPFEWISGPIGIDFYPNQLARNKLATEPGSLRSTGERMQKLPAWNGRKNHLCIPNTTQRG